MHSNGSEYDNELQIPKKRIKLSTGEGSNDKKDVILSQILVKEIQKEINLRKEDLELIEDNIFFTRQKLIHLKQMVADDYYRQKSVKGFLQHPPHPAVKDGYGGKCPVGSEANKIINEANFSKSSESSSDKIKTDPTKEVAKHTNQEEASVSSVIILDHDKLPCYIAPKKVDGDDIKPAEPRDIDSKKQIRIIVGNVSKWLAPCEISDATHKWTVYAKLADPDLDISSFVNKVVFFLHKSYRPNDVIEIKNPPFKLTRRGWGEFPLKAQFHFKSPFDAPIDVMHNLKLDHVHTGFETFGAETSLTVWVHFPVECDIHNFERTLNQLANNDRKDNNDLKKETSINNSESYFSRSSEEIKMNCFDNANSLNDVLSINDYSLFKDEILNSILKPELVSEPESSSCLFDNINGENLLDISFEDLNLPYEKFMNKQTTTYDCFENQFKSEQNSINCLDDLDGLLVDECTVVAEEVVIGDDENNDLVKNDFVDTKEYSDDNKNGEYLNVEVDAQNMFTLHSKPDISLTKIPNSTVTNCESRIFGEHNISSEKYDCNTTKNEMIELEQSINDKPINAIFVVDKSSNKLPKKIDNLVPISKNLSEEMHVNKKLSKQPEKKSMIITLQKENGQIILRKEAKIRKLKENISKGGSSISSKESKLHNNPSLLKSKTTTPKQSPVLFNVKKESSLKLISNELLKLNQNAESVSKFTSTSANNIQKKILPGVSLLKKIVNVSKEDACHNLNDCDLIKQCPIQNTEIAINWLMKKFPLVDGRSVNSGFHTKHPYCANSREAFLKWPLAKQRAAEWMRAKAIGRILEKIPSIEKWKTLEILDWARVRCYTPVKNDPEYNGPTVETTLNFLYQPKIDGIREFLKNHKMAMEEELVDVVNIDPPIKKENVESTVSSTWTAYETDLVLPLSAELQGYKSYINRCMMNSVGELPSNELLLPGIVFPSVERVLISVFTSIAEELIRRSYNASWIRHCDNPPPEISVSDVKAAILSRNEFDFLLPCRDDKGKEQPSFLPFFRK